MKDGLLGVLFRVFRLFGDNLVSWARGAGDLSMADGLVILVDDVNLNEVSPLVREVLGLEAGGGGGRVRDQTGIADL